MCEGEFNTLVMAVALLMMVCATFQIPLEPFSFYYQVLHQ